MFSKLQVPVLGVIENMSYFICPGCGQRHEIFASGTAEQRFLAMGLPFLGAIPLHPAVRAGGDEGRPVVLGDQTVLFAIVLLNPRGETRLFGRRLRELRSQLGQRHALAVLQVGEGPVMFGAHEIPFAFGLLNPRRQTALLG